MTWTQQPENDPRPPTEAPGRVAGVLVCHVHAASLQGLQTAHGSVASHARRVASVAAQCRDCIRVQDEEVPE